MAIGRSQPSTPWPILTKYYPNPVLAGVLLSIIRWANLARRMPPSCGKVDMDAASQTGEDFSGYLSRTREIAFGGRGRATALVLTLYELLMYLATVATAGWFWHAYSDGGMSIIPRPPLTFLVAWFFLVMSSLVIGVLLVAYCLNHVQANRRLTQFQQGLWVLGNLYFFPCVPMVYWFLHVRYSDQSNSR
jgi:hypothetical protein